jgi:1-acyl-sn-glycerol-3-phosphate acyltransferase
MHWVYYFGRFLIHILVFPFAIWEVKGKENLPEHGPVLIVSNHLYLGDPPILAASLRLKAVFMAKEELFRDRWSRFWVQNFGAFPVRRGGIDREAIRQAERWLQEGVSVIMFPEGTRSPYARLTPGLNGAALIASRLGVPILPVGIAGTEKLKKLRLRWHRPRITITIGQPFQLPPADGRLTKEERRRLTDEIMGYIAALLPPEYRGVYAAEKPADMTPDVDDEEKPAHN